MLCPVIGDVLKNLKETNKGFPTYQIDHVVYFKYGYLLFITKEHVPDAYDIFKRFAKVFEQTYTRFLDLQKAEKQTREAEIELALEKVRNRTMAMHHTEELQDVIQTVHQELTNLEIGIHGGSFIAINHEIDKELQFWGSGGTAATLQKFIMPYYDRPFYTNLFKRIKKGPGFFTEAYNAKEKQEFFTFLLQHEPWSQLDKKEKEEVLSTPGGYTRSCCVSEHTTMVIVNHFGRVFDADENLILKRFARVFEQTYTRFLDLQKAEAQAREAQIEAALERVRASTMAMHDSQELAVTNAIVVAQTKSLINSLFAIGIHICHNDEPLSDSWIGDPEEGQMPYLVFDHSSDPLSKIMYNEWKKGNSFHVETMEGKALMDHFKFMGTQVPNREMFEPANLPKRLDFHFAYFSNGFLVFVTTKECPEQYSIFKRLANVFDQTYTRFLDLQKAEAQAKEARIEAALERVRARSMAMHQSTEIGDVAFVLFQQLKSLGGEIWASGFGFCETNSQEDVFWFATEHGISPNVKIPNTTDPAHKTMYEGWKNKQELVTLEKGGVELKNHYNYLLTVPDVQPIFQGILDKGIQFPTWQKWHAAYFKYGYLLVITTKDYENEAIFKRFAKVFEQAYTRFSDLKKAEAQAREAQIEAALERVRTRSMAMHSSEELKDVIRTIFDQLSAIDIDAEHAGIVVDYQPKKDWHFWVAEHREIPSKIRIPYLDVIWDRQFTEAKEKGFDFFTTLLNFEEKNDFYNTILPHIDGLTEKMKKQYFERLGLAISTAIQKDIGLYIENFSGIPYTKEENSILRRFAVVFQQTYTRFLDLQKAEAQAKEAQIEAALERVRSKSLAMHNSKELEDVILVVFKSLGDLGMNLHMRAVGIFTFEENSKDYYQWAASDEYSSVLSFLTPYIDHPVQNDIWNARQNGTEFYSKSYSVKEKNSFFNHLFEHTILKSVMSDKDKKQALDFKFYKVNIAFSKNSALILVGYSDEDFLEEENNILKRFSKVFEQAYIRFLDLKKAEAQAREAQINLAVERVRASALAMHKSEEILNVVAKLKEEVMGLDIPDVVAATIFLEADNDHIRMWDLSSLERSDQGYLAITDITFKLKKVDPHLYIKRVWDNSEDYFIETQNSKDLDRIIEFMYENNQLEIAREVEDYTRSVDLKQLFHATKRLNNGKLCIDLLQEPPEEMKPILDKMGAAFDLAYKRFEDIKNAEKQAREAQIETALEKVRSRSLAMHHSEELGEVITVVIEKLKDLGFYVDDAVALITFIPESKDLMEWMMNPGFLKATQFLLPYFDHPVINNLWEAKEAGMDFVFKRFNKKESRSFHEHIFKYSDFKNTPEQIKPIVCLPQAMPPQLLCRTIPLFL